MPRDKYLWILPGGKALSILIIPRVIQLKNIPTDSAIYIIFLQTKNTSWWGKVYWYIGEYFLLGKALEHQIKKKKKLLDQRKKIMIYIIWARNKYAVKKRGVLKSEPVSCAYSKPTHYSFIRMKAIVKCNFVNDNQYLTVEDIVIV